MWKGLFNLETPSPFLCFLRVFENVWTKEEGEKKICADNWAHGKGEEKKKVLGFGSKRKQKKERQREERDKAWEEPYKRDIIDPNLL